MLKYDFLDKATVHNMHLITGKPHDECKEFFEGFITYLLLNYMEGKSTHMPFLGEINVTYKGDVAKRKGKEAQVDIDVNPASLLLRVVGQVEDGDVNDIEQLFLRRIKGFLQKYDTEETT